MKLTSAYTETFKSTKTTIKGRAVGFRIDHITLGNGKPATREFMTHPGAVGVLAFPSKDKILLVKQYRYPVHQFTYEIPAGKLDKGEDPRKCVVRELEEEAGYRAQKIRKLVSFWPTAAFSDEVIHLYIATDLRATQENPDEDEFIEVVQVSPKTMEQMIARGQIQDSKTLIAYALWKARLAGARR
jgi:ADP-ribose pyrophosphatase